MALQLNPFFVIATNGFSELYERLYDSARHVDVLLIGHAVKFPVLTSVKRVVCCIDIDY